METINRFPTCSQLKHNKLLFFFLPLHPNNPALLLEHLLNFTGSFSQHPSVLSPDGIGSNKMAAGGCSGNCRVYPDSGSRPSRTMTALEHRVAMRKASQRQSTIWQTCWKERGCTAVQIATSAVHLAVWFLQEILLILPILVCCLKLHF